MGQNSFVRLAPTERLALRKRVKARSLRAEDVRRARLILMLAKGDSCRTVMQRLGCNEHYVLRWKRRFLADRIAGLYSRHRGRSVQTCTPALQAKILNATRKAPSEGSTHWSTRKLAKHLGVSHMMVARVWRSAKLRPHQMRRYMLSDDPAFENKAADIIGL